MDSHFAGKLNDCSHIVFRVFGNTFDFATDDPDSALLCPRYSFGLEPEIHSPNSNIPVTDYSLALLKAEAPHASLITEGPVRSVCVGPGETMLFSQAAQCGAAALRGDVRARQRTALSAGSLFVRLAAHACGVFFMHASAVCSSRGAALFVGGNEAGKSTLSLELVCRGMDPLADDNLPLQPSRDGVFALPVREAVNASKLGPHNRRILIRRGYSPAQLDDFMFPPGDLPRPSRVRALFFPQWGEEHSVKNASGAFALKALYEACKTPLSGNGIKEYDKMVGQLLEQAKRRILVLRKGVPAPDPFLEAVLSAAAG